MVELNQNPTNSDENIEYEYVELEPGQELPEGYEYEYVDEDGNKISDPSELDVLNMPIQNNMADEDYSTSPNGIENAIHSAQDNVDFSTDNSYEAENETAPEVPFPSFLQAPKEEQTWLDGEPLSPEDFAQDDMPHFLNENEGDFSFENENSADTNVSDVQVSVDDLELNNQNYSQSDEENSDILTQLNPSGNVDVNVLPDVPEKPNNNGETWADTSLELDDDFSFEDFLNDTKSDQNTLEQNDTIETLTTEVEDNGNTYPVEEEIIAPQDENVDYVEDSAPQMEDDFANISENIEEVSSIESEPQELLQESDTQAMSEITSENSDDFDSDNVMNDNLDTQSTVEFTNEDDFDLDNFMAQDVDIQDFVLPDNEAEKTTEAAEEVENISAVEPEYETVLENENMPEPEHDGVLDSEYENTDNVEDASIIEVENEEVSTSEYETVPNIEYGMPFEAEYQTAPNAEYEATSEAQYDTVQEENLSDFNEALIVHQDEKHTEENVELPSEKMNKENHNIDEKDISPQVVYPEVENLDIEKYDNLLSMSRLINKNMGIQNFSASDNVHSIVLDDVDFEKDELASWNLILFAQEVAPLSERVNVIGKANPQLNYFASLMQNGEKQVEFFNEEDLKILNTSKTCVAVKGNFICGDFAENGAVYYSNFMTIPLQKYAGKIIKAQTPLSGLLTGPNGSLLFFANVSQIVIPNSEIKEIDADKLQYKISKWYSGTLRDKYFEFDAHSQSAEFDGNEDMNAIHVNVNTSSYGWNVTFDNGITMNLRDLREYQTRFGKMPSKNGVLSYGQRTLTFKNVERIVVYEEAQYYFYS